eukprot:466066_1
MSKKKKGGKGKKADDSLYVKISDKLLSSDWDDVYASLDAASKKKLFAILDKKKEILKKRKASEKKRASAAGKRPSGKAGQKDSGGRGGRMVMYNFGSRKLQVLRPSKDYPDKRAARAAVRGKLKLAKVHGYSGNFDESRQNIYLSQDGSCLMFYIAAVVVVFDYAKNTQKFFTKHNDDITTICLSPKKTWCASGQKDPKDEPGKGKDLPKIYIWNYKTLKSVQLLDNVCWGKIARLNWSSASDYLYCICGDADQTLKAWDPKEFGAKKNKGKEIEPLIKCNTMRESIYGFEINPKPDTKKNVDEFLVFCKRKFGYAYITKGGKKGLACKIKAVSVVSLKKDGEKSFACGQFLDNGNYLVGSSSGAIYVGKENTALAILESAHDKAVGAMKLASGKLLTAGSDRKLKTWKIGECKDKKSGLEKTWECSVEVKDSDMVLQPRAMAYNDSTGTVFVGTKTNQIVQFEMKAEEASVIVDGHDGQIWALCTSPNEKLFATGGYDNAVKVWDADAQRCIATHECEPTDEAPKGYQFCSGHWSNNGDILAFGTEDSNIVLYTWKNGTLNYVSTTNIPPKNANAEIEGVAYLRFSNDSKLLAAAHMDSNLYIFSVDGIGSAAPTLEQWPPMSHIAAPTNVQFTADSGVVKTLTRDYEIAHWTLDAKKKKGKFLTKQPDPDDTEWADDPLIAGWDTQGLYQSGWDGTDLNDATVTSDNKLIASGDDYGCVRLHNYPAVDPENCIEYHGHAEFVVGVEFLRDDSQLITCGGNDMAIFQWKVLKGGK